MRTAITASILLAGCGSPPQSSDGSAAPPAAEAVDAWSVTGDGTELSYGARGKVAIRLICPKGDGRLLVNVPAFRPIGSEERFSLGSGETIMTLVADTNGDQGRGGVTAVAPQPGEIKQLLSGQLRASYGAQNGGPYPAVPEDVQRPFVRACSDSATAARVAASAPDASTHPCEQQDGELVRVPAMRALGTEPFWNARTQGRCVTYSTPDDQAGTRVWTKVNAGPMGPIWAGTLGGKPFVLKVQPAVGCSDGMSDRRYDWEARLTVAGEERKGCAERL